MAQVVAQYPYTLENSTSLTRPDFKAFLQPDTNAGGTNMYQYIKSENERKLHIPTVNGPRDFSVLNEKPPSASKTTKKGYDLETIDPISSFISPAGEFLVSSGNLQMKTFGKSKVEPHTMVPQNVHSIRNREEAIDEIRRELYGQENPNLKWNSRKVPDAIIRARLGGWTSEKRSKTESNIVRNRIEDLFPNMKNKLTDVERDELAKKYMYTSSTQKTYGEVHWDSKLAPKLHAPVKTFELKPDPLKNTDELYARPQIWQNTVGQVWDRIQDRKPNFTRSAVAFTSPNKRGDQIPGYSGVIGGVNSEYKDDVIEKFTPFSVLRTQQPKPTAPNFKPDIPGYTGLKHNFKTTSVSHYDKDGRPYTTYAAYHRELPLGTAQIETLAGDFSRILTKVPPENPFNAIHKPADPTANHSLDFTKHSIIIAKSSNDPIYHATTREKEIKAQEAANLNAQN